MLKEGLATPEGRLMEEELKTETESLRSKVTLRTRRANAELTAHATEHRWGSRRLWWSQSYRGPRWSQGEGGFKRSQKDGGMRQNQRNVAQKCRQVDD